MAGIVNELLSIVGFGTTRKRPTKSKKARLGRMKRRLSKKLEEKKLEGQIKTMKKRLEK